MNVCFCDSIEYCDSICMVQRAGKRPSIVMQYCACAASKEKDAKLYIVKSSLNADKANMTSCAYYHSHINTI